MKQNNKNNKNNKQIKGSKIAEHLVNIVALDYIEKVLKPFSNTCDVSVILDMDEKYKEYKTYKNDASPRRKREKQYDNITLLIYIKNDMLSLERIKTNMFYYLSEKLQNEIKISDNNIIIGLYPMYGSYKSDTKLVQINHIITNDKNEYGFIKNFLNLSKERQELYVNLINKSTDIFSGAKSMFYYRLKQNLLSYYVIKPDGKETLVWTSHDWNKVLEILDEILIDVCNVDNYVNNMILDDIKYHLKEYI